MTNVLGIIGASYSGTTMMTMLLGAIPGWFPAGETHWLRHTPYNQFYCPACSGSCTEWTDDLRWELKRTDTWWDAMRAGLSQYDWLVSSDKLPNFYAENPGVDHYLVQWKDPRSWYYSAKRHDGQTAEGAAGAWSGLYNRAFELMNGDVPVTFVDWDAFCVAPVEGLNEILADLDLDPVEHLPRKNPNHMIGGNSEAIGLDRSAAHQEQFGQDIRPDTRWMSVLDPEEARAVIHDRRVADVLDKLRKHSRDYLT